MTTAIIIAGGSSNRMYCERVKRMAVEGILEVRKNCISWWCRPALIYLFTTLHYLRLVDLKSVFN